MMRNSLTFAYLLVATALTTPLVAGPPSPEKSPVPAADSLKYVQLPDDLQVELAAAEPEVVDPIDLRFDEFGRMYVVEMRDYPLGPKPGEPPLSRIKLLEDRDGDGRYETAHVFADKLLFATGVQPWKGGVIVTLAGRVAYLKDTDGDYKADVDETWFTGFAQENSQLRANHPRFAHDNHIYIANGLRGGKIVDRRSELKAPGANASGSQGTPIDISGRDFRFDPRGGGAEAVSGVGQYGLCFDDFGHRFVCQNRNPLQHVVFEESDLKESKHYTPPAVMNDVAAFAEKSKLFPLTKTWTTSNLHENTFTAACGVNIYRGHALPEQYRGLAFTCDPTGNLVHAEKMEPWGPTFRSKPLFEDREFLASTDEWFRPVAVENGPDGALYVADMYRAVIEHPDWVPDELKRRPDERWGDDRGRIYRIVPKGWKRKDVDLPGKVKQPALVELLAHENAWQRERAQRLLLESGDELAAEALRGASLVKRSRHEDRSIARVATAATDPWSRCEALLKAQAPICELFAEAFSLVDERSPDAAVPASKAHLEAFAREIGQLAGRVDEAATIDNALTAMNAWWSNDKNAGFVRSGILGLAEGLQRKGKRLSDVAQSNAGRQLMERMKASTVRAAANPDRQIDARMTDVTLLSYLETPQTLSELTRDPEQSVRIAAIKGLLATSDDKAADLLARVRSESPAAKRAILEGLVARASTLTPLLYAIDKSDLATTDIDPALLPSILNVADPALKARAQKLFAPPPDADRQKTLDTYTSALKAAADAKAGRAAFEKHCSTCHKVGDVGVNVAPDISDSRTKTSQQILLDILQPNRAVDGNFVAYVVTTTDGKVLTGVVSTETSQAITLKSPGGQTIVVPRSEIEELSSTGKSLMPEGLERTISPEQMAELISYIKNWRYLDGRIPASTVPR